jgi:hypothetical protein
MLTIIFLGMIALLAVAGVVISFEAKRRTKGTPSPVAVQAGPTTGRATPDND